MNWRPLQEEAFQKLIRPTNLSDAIPEMTSQQSPQGDAIGVADARGDLIDTLVPRLQQMYGSLHPQTLKI